MTKEEVNKLHEELNELSALEEQNLSRMVEIAKVLNAYYMGGKHGENVEDAEKEGKRNQTCDAVNVVN